MSKQKHNNMQRNEDVEDLDLGQREPTISPVSSDDEFDPQDKDDMILQTIRLIILKKRFLR